MLGLPSCTPIFISLGIDIPVDESNLPPGGVTQGRCRNGSSTPPPNMILWPRLVPPTAAFERARQPNRPSRTGSRRAGIGWSGALGAMVDLRRRHFSTPSLRGGPYGHSTYLPLCCRHGRPSGRHPHLCDSPGTRL